MGTLGLVGDLNAGRETKSEDEGKNENRHSELRLSDNSLLMPLVVVSLAHLVRRLLLVAMNSHGRNMSLNVSSKDTKQAHFRRPVKNERVRQAR